MEPKHTPTPWKLIENDSTRTLTVFAPQHWPVKGTSIGACETENDAEFIVRAVNAHEELLQTLRHVKQQLNLKLDWPAVLALQGQVAQAIAKAEGK